MTISCKCDSFATRFPA